MPLSWNEIRHNAIAFARDWAGAKGESANALTFWREFFPVFGLPLRAVVFFEGMVRYLPGTYDCIDLFWMGTLLVEHTSPGHSLELAESQAHRYICNLASAGRQDDAPRYVIASDFARISLLDLEPDALEKRAVPGGYRIEFPLGSLHRHIQEFAFILGDRQNRLEDHSTSQGA